jgi:hypothetical protein
MDISARVAQTTRHGRGELRYKGLHGFVSRELKLPPPKEGGRRSTCTTAVTPPRKCEERNYVSARPKPKERNVDRKTQVLKTEPGAPRRSLPEPRKETSTVSINIPDSVESEERSFDCASRRGNRKARFARRQRRRDTSLRMTVALAAPAEMRKTTEARQPQDPGSEERTWGTLRIS